MLIFSLNASMKKKEAMEMKAIIFVPFLNNQVLVEVLAKTILKKQKHIFPW